jgi:hypothetical protein
MCVLISSPTLIRNIYHSKKNWARYDKKTYIDPHVKYPLFLSEFNETSSLLTILRKVLEYKISRKPVQR